MDISIKHLQALVWVADMGSFRRAAERLHTTQPNVSTRIAVLESRVGQRLMERDAGSVRLTPKGTELLAQARKVLRALDEFAEAAQASSLPGGVLRLGVTELVARLWLKNFVKIMRERFGHISLELTVDLSSVLDAELSRHALDLAVHNGPFRHAVNGVVDLASYPFAWVAAPALGLDILRSDAPYSLFLPARSTAPYEQIAAHCATSLRPARLVPSSSVEVVLQMACEAMGVALVPRAMAQDALLAGRLIELDYPWLPAPLVFQARFHAQQSISAVAAAATLAAQCAAEWSEQRAAADGDGVSASGAEER